MVEVLTSEELKLIPTRYEQFSSDKIEHLFHTDRHFRQDLLIEVLFAYREMTFDRRLQYVNKILTAGIDINFIAPNIVAAPLHIAVRFDNNSPLGDVRLVETLLRAGADVNIQETYGGATPLHYAIAKKDQKLIFLLKKWGADFYLRDDDGLTPWQYMQRENVINPYIETIAAKLILGEDHSDISLQWLCAKSLANMDASQLDKLHSQGTVTDNACKILNRVKYFI